MSAAPWDFETATANCRKAAVAQESAEAAYLAAARDFAAAEEAYRKALAVEIVRAHDSGVAWTAAADLARGDDNVARLRRERDIAEGVREAMEQALWRHVANRKDAQRFADWSQRRELAEAGPGSAQPAWSEVGA